MALFDENGNPIEESNNFPTIPEQPPRQVDLSIKDKEEENYIKVDADGNINVVVTDMPPVTVNAEGIVVNVSNQVEVTNSEGDPIPVSGTIDIGNLPTNQNVTVTNTTPIKVDVENLSFPETQTVDGTINVGNFPTTQAVSIADTVDVSIVGEPTVTISNPTTDVSVNNFPTSFEVSNFPTPVTDVTVSGGIEVTNFPATPTEIAVNNFPTQFDVNVVNPTTNVTVDNFPTPPTSIEVSNFPTEIAVNNHPTSIEVSNFPAPVTSVEVSNFPTEITVSNPVTEVSVSNFPADQAVTVSNPVTSVDVTSIPAITGSVEVTNQPTSIEVSNFPTPVTEVTVGNMVSAVDIGEATNEYIEKRYTIYSNNATFYADAMPPTTDPFGRDGFHYYNNWTGTPPVAQKKINWYFYDPTRQTSTYANLQGAWALVTIDRNTNRYPFFYVYGTTNGTTISSAWSFYANLNNLVAGKTYLFYFGEEPTVYPDVPRVALPYYPNTSYGTRNPSEAVFSIALTTDSNNASGSLEIQVYEVGFKANGNNNTVKLQMVNANAQTIIGSVEITNDSGNAIPVSGTVTANVTFPTTQAVSGTVEVSNQPTTIEVSNLPTVQEVSGAVTVSGTVDVGNLAFPTVQDVNVTNQITSVEVSNLPATQDVNITNSTLTVDVNNLAFPEVQTVDGTVLIDSTTPVNVTVSNPVTDVTVSNFPANQTVTVDNPVTSVDVTSLPAINITNTGFDANITNTDLPVTFSNTTIDVGNLPANQDVTITNASVNVTVDNPTTAVDVNNFPANQVVSGTVSVDSLPSITIANNGFDANITNTDLPVTFSNTTIDVGNFPASQVVEGTVSVDNHPTTIEVSNFPTSTEVSNTVDVTGSVDIGNMPNVTIANPQTSVDVTSLPAITIQNTGFNATVTNTSLDVNVLNPVTSVEVTNQPSEIEVKNYVDGGGTTIPLVVSGGNSTFKVTNDINNPIFAEINNGVGNPIGVSGTVAIDDTTPIDVNITNSLTITPPANQNVTVTNTPNVHVSNPNGVNVNIQNASLITSFNNVAQPVNIQNTPSVTATNTEFGITSTQNGVKITDGTNNAGLTSTVIDGNTVIALNVAIIGSIDGGAI